MSGGAVIAARVRAHLGHTLTARLTDDPPPIVQCRECHTPARPARETVTVSLCSPCPGEWVTVFAHAACTPSRLLTKCPPDVIGDHYAGRL